MEHKNARPLQTAWCFFRCAEHVRRFPAMGKCPVCALSRGGEVGILEGFRTRLEKADPVFSERAHSGVKPPEAPKAVWKLNNLNRRNRASG
jgi:hypothetical protein